MMRDDGGSAIDVCVHHFDFHYYYHYTASYGVRGKSESSIAGLITLDFKRLVSAVAFLQ